jgi:hypothetical protein
MPKVKKDIYDLTRRAIGMISLDDLQETENELDGVKRLDYLKEAELVFLNRVFQNELKLMMREQMKFISCEAQTLEQVSVERGVVNCLCLLEERFQNMSNEYRKRTAPKDKNFDPFEVL